ncbi:AAA family ATPase [Campylobacter sp. RM12651]|uniref:AAA family ATPase n=1 Tax=Campylobacter sp. RM12651 TaxID=1660079 RepID=UPI001EFA2DCF|nr:AAA family ATPase [Campylobacter sp. RM12651]ULO03504.1 DNA repair protein RecN [Campylobacter sp. RM12651]
MIERLYFTNNITFDELNLEFKNGLIVFTGSSGAGKSVIFKSILAAFGIFESSASLLEISIDDKINDESIENSNPNVFRVKKDKVTRYFINNQAVSKKIMSELNASNIRYLSAKNYDDFEPNYLLKMLDLIIIKKEQNYENTLNEYKNNFKKLDELEKEYKKLCEDENKINDLKELLSLEIKKIKDINPKIGEYEKLLDIKTKLSKRDKIEQALRKSEGIFAYESSVLELLRLANIDSEFFVSAMNELNDIYNDLNNDSSELDIEEILNRLEKLHYLVKRYGSVEDALNILKDKEKELNIYENIDYEKDNIEKELKTLKNKLISDAKAISKIRLIYLNELECKINDYLNLLYLDKIALRLVEFELGINGIDRFEISLNKAGFKEISSGELNRLRLAFLASFADFIDYANGYIFLDEIDANLSGKEAISIANVISKLSKHYQIFVITHMPWICAKANQHFLVSKENNKSFARELRKDEVANELARMISDENISQSALDFAKTILEGKE